MRYASVCSGVEAASLAWMPLGWEAAFFSEIEPFPCAVLKERFPNVPNLGDMTKIKIDEKGDIQYGTASVIPNDGQAIDLLVGGTPCQSFSVAGKREGLRGVSGLALDYIRLAFQLAAHRGLQTILWENVPGVFNANSGLDFATFLSGLAGWDVAVPHDGWGNAGVITNATEGNFGLAYRTLDAQYVRVEHGFPRAVPQRRRRVFVVGCLGNWERAAKILFEQGKLFGIAPPSRCKGSEASMASSGDFRKPGECFCIGNGQVQGAKAMSNEISMTLNCMSEVNKILCFDLFEKEGALDSSKKNDGKDVFCIGNGKVQDAICMSHEVSHTLTCRHEQKKILCFESHPQDSRIRHTDVAPTCAAFGNSIQGKDCLVCHSIESRVLNKSKENSSGLGISDDNAPSYTLTASHQNAIAYAKVCRAKGKDGLGERCDKANVSPTLNLFDISESRAVQLVIENAYVRKLMPVETERLMGFPDNWTKIPWRGRPASECPDSHRYKACGNSMCVNVMRWLGQRIDEFTKED